VWVLLGLVHTVVVGNANNEFTSSGLKCLRLKKSIFGPGLLGIEICPEGCEHGGKDKVEGVHC